MSTPYCLSFQDEAQAISVLYTTTTEPIYELVPVVPEVLVTLYEYEDSNGEPFTSPIQFTPEALADDGFTLKGTTQEPETVNTQTGEKTVLTPKYRNIDMLGIVYQPAPDPLPDGYVRVPYPAPNYGVNVLVLDDEDATPIEQYAVNPEPYAQRVWNI